MDDNDIESMTTGNPSLENVPLRPGIPVAVPNSLTPISSSESMVFPGTTVFRPAFSTDCQIIKSFSSSALLIGQETPIAGSTHLDMTNVPSLPHPPFSCAPSTASPGHQWLPSMSIAPVSYPSSVELTAFAPELKPPTGFSSTPTTSFHQEPQIISRSVQPLTQSMNPLPSLGSPVSALGPNFHPFSSAFPPTYPLSTVRSQSKFLACPSDQTNALAQSVFASCSAPSCGYQVDDAPQKPITSSYFADQGNHVSPPLVAAPTSANSGNQISEPSSGALVGRFQHIVDDFNSLSLRSAAGSIDPGLDFESLPRPKGGDVKPDSSSDIYPVSCSSRYLRLTTYAMPNSQSLLSRWHLPLGAVICPLAEASDGEEVPVVTTGTIRCTKCSTYLNPYITFVNCGRKWQCNICRSHNDVPPDCFSYLDVNGKRMDFAQRPELRNSSVEYIASPDYMVQPPMPPLYVFLIDVSVYAARSGMLEVLADTVRSCLDRLPSFMRTRIGFITFDSRIHFYNLKSSLIQPQMMVVSDVDDVFVPVPDDLIVNLSESRSLVDAFLDGLPSMFEETRDVESAFGPAVKVAFMLMRRIGGKLLVFQNTLPSLGLGCLRLRNDDHRLYGTDKEHLLRLPEDPFYKQMATDCAENNISMDVYAFSDKYTDIASLGTLAKHTGGQVYYYPDFQSAGHKEKMKHELSRNLTRETAWGAVMRIRHGRGVRLTVFHENMMLKTSDTVSLPTVDCDKAYTVQLHLEEPILTSQAMYFQVALLYTLSSGERRIRVHTAAIPVVADLGEMYRRADTGAIISLFCGLAIEKTLSHKLEEARSFIQEHIVKSLREYQNLIPVQNRSGGRTFYPESLKYMPLYGLALCKSIPLRGGYGDVQLDERCAAGTSMVALTIKRLLKLLYPNLFRIDEYIVNASPKVDLFDVISNTLPLTVKSLDTKGLYMYDDGIRIVLWFGRMLLPDIAFNLLGEDIVTDHSKVNLYGHDNQMSRKLMSMLEKLREIDPSYYQLPHLVRQGEQPGDGVFLASLIEDQVGSMIGLVEWAMRINHQVQQIF